MSYFTYAFDPSTVATGFALFEHDDLVRVEVIEADGIDEMISKLHETFSVVQPHHDISAIVETPITYPGDPRPLDILKVAVVAGACRAHFRTSSGIAPSGWNRGRPKKITHARIKDLLAPEKIAMVMALRSGIRDNAWDAIGIGMHHLGVLR